MTDFVVRTSCYGSFLVGVLILAFDGIKEFCIMFYYGKRLRKSRKAQFPFLTMANRLVLATLGKKNKGGYLIGASVILGSAGAILGFELAGLYYGIGMFLVLLICPTLILKVKLETVRNRGSREGESFVAEMISKYRMSGYNMNSCLEALVDSKKGNSVCYAQCEQVLSKIREASKSGELYRCADNFGYAIGTNWSRMLAYNIGQSLCFGYNVMSGLEDILGQLREAKMQEEERKRLNAETARLVLFMVPFAYLITVYFSTCWLGLGFRKLLHNQFCTLAGVSLFMAIGFAFLINLVLLSVVKNRSFDY